MRTDFSTAIQRVLHTLKNGDPYTLNKLSQEAKLNFRTVKKIIDFLQKNQISTLDKTLEVSSTDNLTFIRLKEKSGLALYPEHIQQLIIRTTYYPTTTREEEVLAYLFLHEATNGKSAVNISKDKIVEELIKAEHLAKTNDGRYYLTEDGIMIARGAIKLYPELDNIKFQKQDVNSVQDYSMIFHGLSVPGPPLLPIIESMLARKR